MYPALALAQELKRRRPYATVHFVGTRRGLEKRVVPDLGYPLHLIAVRGVARRTFLKNILVPLVLFWSLVQSFVLMVRFRPAAVIGTGGYVSGPVLFMASLLRFPTLIQEQNSYPGATTRLLAPRAQRVHLSFEESQVYFQKKDNIRITGNPVRPFDTDGNKQEARRAFRLDPDRLTVLIFGGSQGARALNTVLLDCLDDLIKLSDVQFIWSAGLFDADVVQRKAAKWQERVWTGSFIKDMATAYSAADLVVSRAGALTLAEVTLCGLPSILIPLPSAAANHQVTNAQALQESGAARVILQQELTPDVLRDAVLHLLADEAERLRMAAAAREAAFPQATQNIVDSILEIARISEEDYESKNR